MSGASASRTGTVPAQSQPTSRAGPVSHARRAATGLAGGQRCTALQRRAPLPMLRRRHRERRTAWGGRGSSGTSRPGASVPARRWPWCAGGDARWSARGAAVAVAAAARPGAGRPGRRGARAGRGGRGPARRPDRRLLTPEVAACAAGPAGWPGLLRRWSLPGSNRRPSRCKRDALPAELRPQGVRVVQVRVVQRAGVQRARQRRSGSAVAAVQTSRSSRPDRDERHSRATAPRRVSRAADRRTARSSGAAGGLPGGPGRT